MRGWCRGRTSARLWPLILIKVPCIDECVIKKKGAVGKDGKKLTIAQKKKKPHCGSSRMRCVQCDEHICDDCWKKGYDKHEGMPKK